MRVFNIWFLAIPIHFEYQLIQFHTESFGENTRIYAVMRL